MLKPRAPGRLLAGLGFREGDVAFMFKPVMQVAEAVLIGNQVDKPFSAVSVQDKNLFRRHRRRRFPHFAVIVISKGMFDVKLKLIDFPACQQVDQTEQGVHRGHFVPADV